MNFIKSKKRDIPSIIEIRQTFLAEEHPEMTDAQFADIKRRLPVFFKKHLNKDFFVYLCYDAKAVASVFLAVTEKPANLNMPTGKIGTIYNVYTAPEHRKQGIAKTLMKMAMNEAAKMDLSYLELKATEAGESLYAGLGFHNDDSPYKPMKYIFTDKNKRN